MLDNLKKNIFNTYLDMYIWNEKDNDDSYKMSLKLAWINKYILYSIYRQNDFTTS